MKKKIQIVRDPSLALRMTVLVIAFALVGCKTVEPGNDPIVVNAERDTRLAADTFDLLVHTEYDQRANLKAISPSTAAAVKQGADQIRLHSKQWLKTARAVTMTYKNNRTPANKANLQTALSVLSMAVSESQQYLNQINNATKSSP